MRREGIIMHLSDGVLNLPAVAVTSVVAGGMVVNSFRNIKEDEIPKISLMTATFFTFALISFPVGPSSVHPLLGGLLGIILGRRSTIAVFIGLLLQAVIFQHGGLTTLGMNTIMVGLPAIMAHKVFSRSMKKKKSITLSAALVGALSVLITVLILVTVLFFTNNTYSEGFFSVINVLVLGHLPLAILESFITAITISFIYRVRPKVLENYVENLNL
ncbi:MAG: CbiM family transporter [Clostridiaceae bacterium]